MGKHPFRDFTGNVATPEEANQWLATWKKYLPKVEAVSLTQGAKPRTDWDTMLAAAVVAIPIAFAVETLVAPVALIVISLVGGLFLRLLDSWGSMNKGFALLFFIPCVIAGCLPFIAGAKVVIAQINRGATKSQNGDPYVASVAATLACIVSFAGMLAVFHFAYAPLMIRYLGFEKWLLYLVVYMYSLGGIGLAIRGSINEVSSFAKKQECCNKCGGIVRKSVLKVLQAEELQQAMAHVKSENIEGIHEILSQPAGESGDLSLTKCEECSRGLLELVVTYEVGLEATPEKLERFVTWLAASKEWNKENVALIVE